VFTTHEQIVEATGRFVVLSESDPPALVAVNYRKYGDSPEVRQLARDVIRWECRPYLTMQPPAYSLLDANEKLITDENLLTYNNLRNWNLKCVLTADVRVCIRISADFSSYRTWEVRRLVISLERMKIKTLS